MSTVKDHIRSRIKYILQNESDDQVLMQLNEELAVYESRAKGEEVFSPNELEQIDQAYHRSKDAANLVSHEDVKKNLWEKIERYSGKA